MKLNFFFVMIKMSQEIDVIPIEKITRKFIKIVVDSDIYLSILGRQWWTQLKTIKIKILTNKELLTTFFNIV